MTKLGPYVALFFRSQNDDLKYNLILTTEQNPDDVTLTCHHAHAQWTGHDCSIPVDASIMSWVAYKLVASSERIALTSVGTQRNLTRSREEGWRYALWGRRKAAFVDQTFQAVLKSMRVTKSQGAKWSKGDLQQTCFTDDVGVNPKDGGWRVNCCVTKRFTDKLI